MNSRWRIVVAALTLLACIGISRTASAYPWMIRHGYPQCATCHTEPSGGGLLTAYGRAQSELLLSASFRGGGEAADEASRASEFAFGLFRLPESLLVQGWIRNGAIWNYSDGTLADRRGLFMRGDVGAHLHLGRLRASATVGVATNEGRAQSQEAWVTSSTASGGVNLVSRDHWVGVDLLEERALLRAGRIELPFGLRNIEHTSFVRTSTRTDINQNQQHGAAFAFATDALRLEIMAVLGNFQEGPDAFRERGLVGSVEAPLLPRLAIGASALATRAARDDRGTNVYRQAYGVHVRYAAPWKPLVLLAETDGVLHSSDQAPTSVGYATFLQADVEAVRGLHVLGTFEASDSAVTRRGWARGAWLSVLLFPVSHLDLRLDVLRRWNGGAATTDTLLLQLHGYL